MVETDRWTDRITLKSKCPEARFQRNFFFQAKLSCQALRIFFWSLDLLLPGNRKQEQMPCPYNPCQHPLSPNIWLLSLKTNWKGAFTLSKILAVLKVTQWHRIFLFPHLDFQWKEMKVLRGFRNAQHFLPNSLAVKSPLDSKQNLPASCHTDVLLLTVSDYLTFF